MIPNDDFTPHGYLDNPFHCWKLNPSGVLRSTAPMGMGWHVPNLGSYVRNQFQYTAHLSLALKINDLALVTPDDFKRNKCVLSSHIHSKNRFEYTCVVPRFNLTVTARYFLIQEHALGCILTLMTTAKQPLQVTCYLLHLHTHNPFTSRLWEHGLYACDGTREGTAALGIASEGDVFVHGARSADGLLVSFEAMGYVVSLDEAALWIKGYEVERPHIIQSQPDTGWQVRTVILPCSVTLGGMAGPAERIINVVLARGVSQDQANQFWEDGIEEIARADAEHRKDDEAFWSEAPQLSGAWPDSWRRGLVYDLETLRMTIRPSVGVIPHSWDGMQIQAPREVLAEAAMDMLFFSYANPELAAEVMLGHFEFALQPHLPCMREDGSYNMVADDGQVCGTAPEWGFPLWCCDQLMRKSGDLPWLRRLYPPAAAYLRWWLEHRRDADGWLFYDCSWESGQDVSSRFGPQQTGGTIIQHVRPVDLQASMAQGADILVRWATLLQQAGMSNSTIDYAAEIELWRNIAREFTLKTQAMWQRDWFRDYDSVTGEWSEQQDTMHLAPVFCGIASQEQVESLRPFLTKPPKHSSGWAPLSWPPVVMTLIGAAAEAQMPLDAAELAYRFIDASYRSTDRRELDERAGLPGVTREYRQTVAAGKWGEIDYVNAGIEGYGWGALSVHLLIRYVLGLRAEAQDKITMAPALPQALRRVGASYRVGPIPWSSYLLDIECVVRNAEGYTLRLRCKPRVRAASMEAVDAQESPELATMRECVWEGIWGEGRTLLLPELAKSNS